MSIHYHKPNYQCPKCKSFFLPYKKGIQCPNCGMAVKDADAKKYLDVIDLIASSMEIHKKKHGMYFPGGWYIGDFMDKVQYIIYRAFDSMEHFAKPGEEKKYIMKMLGDKRNWEDFPYQGKHMEDIASEVFEIYKAKNFSKIERSEPDKNEEKNEDENKIPAFIVSKMRRSAKWERIKKWFRGFLP